MNRNSEKTVKWVGQMNSFLFTQQNRTDDFCTLKTIFKKNENHSLFFVNWNHDRVFGVCGVYFVNENIEISIAY